MLSLGPSPIRMVLPWMPQASSIKAEVAGHRASSRVASCNEATMRVNVSWSLTLAPFPPRGRICTLQTRKRPCRP